jgi:nucleoside-diphosphate-sugar epimerase
VIGEHVRRFGPHLVVHLAAKVGPAACEADPDEARRANVVATEHVARACAAARAQLVYASTADVYGAYPGRAGEEAPLDPLNLYSRTKAEGEEAAREAPEGLRVVRIAYPYGPPAHPDGRRGAFATMVWQAERREPLVAYRGRPTSWCWIGDLAQGIRAVVERGDAGVYNVGRDDEPISLPEAARMACELAGAPVELVEEVDPPAPRPVVEISAAKLRKLGWRPEVDLDAGMRMLLEWVRSEAVAPAR